MSKRVHPKTKSKTTFITSTSAAGLALFGEPQLLAGEDAAAYDRLLARICAAVKPVDIIDEMFIADVVSLEWEVLRWRRLKTCLMRAHGFEALEVFLRQDLDYNLYSEQFADDLAEILQDNLPEDQAKGAQTLARACARNEREAIDKVNKVLNRIQQHSDMIRAGARHLKAKELVQEYVRREPDAVTLVQELLASANVSMDELMPMYSPRTSTISSGSIASPPSPRAAATTACARSNGVGRSSAKHCDRACKRSRTASSK
jgi:hypothetical protein